MGPGARARMRRALSVVALLVTWNVDPAIARACACRGTSGPGAALTMPDETFGAAAVLVARHGLGAWDERGGYHAFGGSVKQDTFELTLGGAVRVHDTVEVAAFAPLVWSRFVASSGASGQDETTKGFGDASARLRWEAYRASPIDYDAWVSTVAAGLALRAPTGTGSRTAGAGGVGSPASSTGLGTWEVAGSLDLRLRLSTRWQTGAVGELAWRAPDTSLGQDRHLGPRGLGRVLIAWFPEPMTSLGAHVDVALEGDVTYRGETAHGSRQRLVTTGLFGMVDLPYGLRLGGFAAVAPPVANLSINAVASVSAGVSLGFSR